MLYVIDGFLEQSCHVIIVERVKDVSSPALADYQPEVTKRPQLMRDGGLLHRNPSGELTNRARGLRKTTEYENPARRRESLDRLSDLSRQVNSYLSRGCSALHSMSHV